ncbi:hypothetical protein KAR91_77855 [Candidatus Pacearchaeota archaeon]|nr:hypothetical protein [Candidatus Pacearchaeota archaeon]
MVDSIGAAEQEAISLPITGTMEILQFAMLQGWSFSKTATINYTAGSEEDIVNYIAGDTREGKDFFLVTLVVGGETAGTFKLYINGAVITPLYISDFDSKWFLIPSPLLVSNGDEVKVTFFHGSKGGEVSATFFGFETDVTEILQSRAG